MCDITNIDDSLPKPPKDVCFLEHVFIQDNFDVDAFLQDHRKNAKLETMRDDLGMYLKLLRSAMIDLINRDYADFVNLSSNLIGLDRAINDLQIPLGQLKEEVIQVQQVLDDEVDAISQYLNDNRQTRGYKQCLCSLQCIYKSLRKLVSILSLEDSTENIKIDILEQAAVEFNQLKFHLIRCRSHTSKEQENESEQLERKLEMLMNKLFLKYIAEKNVNLLTRCLRIYVMLDKVSYAEYAVRKDIVSPIIDNMVNEENFQTDALGLRTTYSKLLSILSLQLQQLLDITSHKHRTGIKGFNFIVNSFWVEVEEKIERYMKDIFAPGDPELFHRRYIETLKFLIKLEEKCEASSTIKLQSHPQYKRFLKKWNLPVYFQIRFQEIAGTVEAVYEQPISPASIKGSMDTLGTEEFSLHVTVVTWDSLLRIWSDEIYLQQLFQRFWKLSLQVCSRYQNWSQSAIKRVWPTVNEVNVYEARSTSRLSFLVYLYTDIEKFTEKLFAFPQVVHSRIKESKAAGVSKLLEDCLTETRNSVKNMLPAITEEIVRELSDQSVLHLKQVSDIPRLFRRTNREVPSKSCAYVKNALIPLITFHGDYGRIIPTNVKHWLEMALSSITSRYLTFVSDVLTSVQKTEESLRRLKKIRDKSVGTASSAEVQGVTDDEKIRIQLQVDVRSYTQMIEDLAVSASNVQHLNELIQAAESAVKK